MKIIVISLVAIIFSMEAFAQRGPRYNPPRRDRDSYDHHPRRPGPVVVRPGPGRIGPRRVYRPSSVRVYRSYRRSPIIWSTPFGYQCNAFGDLTLNGRRIHSFRVSSDCYQAVEDIRMYGDYCDEGTMFDQTGYREADFNTYFECREALGWYY